MKNDKILKFIIQLLEKKKTIEKKENILSYNFMKKGHIDSLSIIKLILEIENKFKIKFSQSEINSKKFQVIKTLVSLIIFKLKKK